ncbi:unnamed protein product, partial [Darwinula stevensoni]
DLAIETGGCVSDSLEMARFGRDHAATTLVVAGVRFMGESAKILSPEKRVLVPDMEANCSLDLGCPDEEFAKFRAQYPDHTVVVYANTSAAVKAQADWMVTSSIALPIARHLKAQGKKILWAPDKHLGGYIQKETRAEMVLWKGSCIVHDEFKAIELENLKKQYPNAKVLVHPESPADVVRLADVVGSTSAILKAARELDADTFIVATDNGMMHALRQQNPQKFFLEAPTAGSSATCKSCAHCPWMAMNDLQNLLEVLETGRNEIHIDETIRTKALVPIDRMLAFAKDYKAQQEKDQLDGTHHVLPRRVSITALLGSIILVSCYALLQNHWWGHPAGKPLTVASIQGNISQSIKFSADGLQLSYDTYIKSLENQSVDLVITPESAHPVALAQVMDQVGERIVHATKTNHTYYLLGAISEDSATEYANSAYVMNPDGQFYYRYDKHHLVPFGEYIPDLFEWFVKLLQMPFGEFQAGALVQNPVRVKSLWIAPNICYEDLFGEAIARSIRQNSQKGMQPHILANITNLGWFGYVMVLDQHLQIGRMRAFETQKPIIRTTNTGITAYIGANGQ